MKRTLNLLGVMVMVGMLFGVAKADQLAFVTILTGAQEVPPNASPGIGRALVTIDTVTNNRRSKKLFPRFALGTGCAGVAREHNVVRVQTERHD